MKRAITYAIVFGAIAGLINFILKTFLHVEGALFECINIAFFVGLGVYLGIFKNQK